MKRILNTKIFFTCLLFVLAAFYGSADLFLAHPVSASADPAIFSAERAMVHVQVLSRTPRVVGSRGMERAVDYLVETLHGFGLESEIQESPSPKGILRNVIAAIPGKDPDETLLIQTHTDSISFGAGNNASGTAVLLETARALQAGPQPQTNVLLLFDDGEEQGYWGGYAFAKSSGRMMGITRVIGLDTAAWGPVVLLQTTPGNAELIRTYAGTVRSPVAYGFYADADWNISHDTSGIQPFYEQGIPGIALEDPTAFLGKHSAEDKAEYVRLGSLQQMGDQVLALARGRASVLEPTDPDGDLSYFSLWGIGLVHYPANWNIFFAGLAAVGLAIILTLQIRRGTLHGKNLGNSFLLLLGMILLTGLVGLGADRLFGVLFPNPNPSIGSYLNNASLPYFLADLLLISGAYVFVRSRIKRGGGETATSCAGLLIWLLFSVVFAVLLRVGSYILVIPLIAAVLIQVFPGKYWISNLIPAVLATVFLAPNIVLAFLGTGMQTLILVNLLMVLNLELWMQVENLPLNFNYRVMLKGIKL